MIKKKVIHWCDHSLRRFAPIETGTAEVNIVDLPRHTQPAAFTTQKYMRWKSAELYVKPYNVSD